MLEHGITAHHRRSFITTQRVLNGEQEVLPLFDPIDPELDAVIPGLEAEFVPIGA